MRKYREKNKELHSIKIKARRMVEFAIKIGHIEKINLCEECGKIGKMDAHHENYLKPLEIKWLCRVCHKQKHTI